MARRGVTEWVDDGGSRENQRGHSRYSPAAQNVTLDEIQWVVNQLQEHYATAVRKARHGVLFRVGDQRFMVNTHNPGSKQVKSYSVDDFIDAMIELGWYED
jgi:hypothetical protein